MEILEKIKQLIDWYTENSEKAGLHKLLEVKDKLAGFNYHLGELTSQMNKEYNQAYYNRKISVAKKKNWYSKEVSATKAESIAIEESNVEYQKELENEALAERLSILLRQSNLIVRAIEQRISVLKFEMQQTQRQNIT